MDSMHEFPKVRDEIDPKIYHIDGTPDGNYALCILQFYRELARCKWEVDGIDQRARVLYDVMNEHQDARAAELDEAIRILQKQRSNPTTR
jgi:hypothetical protein